MERNYSLPPNYLTLAQLQQRWLKQHNPHNQSESQDRQQSPKQNHREQPHLQVVAPSNGSASKSRSTKQYVVKIPNDSETHRLTAAVESVTEIGGGDKTTYLELDGKGKGSNSNKKIRKVNRKTKTEEDREASGEGSGTTAQEKEKASEKGTIESEVKENGWVKMDEVEERVRVLSINSGNGKQRTRLGKMNNGFRDFGQQRKVKKNSEKKMVWVRKDEI